MSGGVEQDAVSIVEGQVAAYNDHDVERFCAYYAEDIEVSSLGSDTPTIAGKDNFRAHYRLRFSEMPNIHCTIEQRIALGEFVIDLERLTNAGPEELRAVALFQVKAGVIRRVWLAGV